MSREHPEVIDAVEKALTLMETFSAEQPFLTISEAANLTGLTRPTARRLLLTFVHLGFAEMEGRAFRLTPRVLRLGYGYLSALPFWEHAQEHLRQLADEVNEACSAATLDGGEIVYVARIPPRRNMTITLSVGSRLPAYPTSMGRVLLAGLTEEQLTAYLGQTALKPLTARTVTDPDKLAAVLRQVSRQGFALVDGEREEGVRSAAAPVTDQAGRVIAAINISANAGRMPLATLREKWVPRLVETAAAISHEARSSAMRSGYRG